MDTEEKNNESEEENSSAVNKSKRSRKTPQSTANCSVKFDEDSLSSLSDEYFEDEWDACSENKKKGKRAKKLAVKSTLTLKSKLMEKTRKLRQLSKQSGAPIVQHSHKTTLENKNVEISTRPAETKSDESVAQVSEDKKPSIELKCESSSGIKNVECKSSARSTVVENETSVKNEAEICEATKKQCDQEPIVINYSINRSQTCETFLPCNLPSPSSRCITRSNPVNVVNVANAKTGTVVRTEKYGASIVRPIARSNSFRVVKNFSRTNKTLSSLSSRKPSSSNVDKISKHNVETSVVRNGSPSSTVIANRVLTKMTRNNISPNGTVIHTGTGSITITPRKPVSEKPPIQRKIFKNEIEGTISVRNAGANLQYVVNLANGTYVPLSNLQVGKLREQHKGALPIKLKIPVPCDVADKIEPSFLIED